MKVNHDDDQRYRKRYVLIRQWSSALASATKSAAEKSARYHKRNKKLAAKRKAQTSIIKYPTKCQLEISAIKI